VRWKPAWCIASGDNACAKRQVRVPSFATALRLRRVLRGGTSRAVVQAYAIEQLGSEFLRTHGTRLRKIKELGCDQAVGLRSSSWAAIPYLFVYNGRSNSSLLPNFKVVHHLGPLRGGVICMSGTPTPTSGVGVLLMRKSRACSCAYHVCVCVPMMLIHRHAHMCCCRALSET
jgi:hypothetical protein